MLHHPARVLVGAVKGWVDAMTRYIADQWQLRAYRQARFDTCKKKRASGVEAGVLFHVHARYIMVCAADRAALKDGRLSRQVCLASCATYPTFAREAIHRTRLVLWNAFIDLGHDV